MLFIDGVVASILSNRLGWTYPRLEVGSTGKSLFCTCTSAVHGGRLTSTVCLSSIAGSPINTRSLVEKSFCSALIFLSINQRVKYQPSNSEGSTGKSLFCTCTSAVHGYRLGCARVRMALFMNTIRFNLKRIRVLAPFDFVLV